MGVGCCDGGDEGAARDIAIWSHSYHQVIYSISRTPAAGEVMWDNEFEKLVKRLQHLVFQRGIRGLDNLKSSSTITDNFTIRQVIFKFLRKGWACNSI